jgi:hypothetical protein
MLTCFVGFLLLAACSSAPPHYDGAAPGPPEDCDPAMSGYPGCYEGSYYDEGYGYYPDYGGVYYPGTGVVIVPEPVPVPVPTRPPPRRPPPPKHHAPPERICHPTPGHPCP